MVHTALTVITDRQGTLSSVSLPSHGEHKELTYCLFSIANFVR